MMFKPLLTITVCFATLSISSNVHVFGQEQSQGRTISRLFWQDDSDATLRWGDLTKNSDGYQLVANQIDQFPAVDPGEQSLVQMRDDDGLIVVGIHDQADGTIGSGWVAIESGVTEEPHGDHSHWKFGSPPSVTRSLIDDTQGNPAHVYRYGRSFVLANDKNDGFTIVSADSIRQSKSPDLAAKFYQGGSGHITLAVVPDRVAYATWIAPVGENAGRVDVIGLGANTAKGYTIQCPTGGLHGATTNSDKVFFAPSNGVCWVDADVEMNGDFDTVKVNHISLGNDADDKPLRTGAFANLGTHVLFTAGKGVQSKLCVLDASGQEPTMTEVHLNLAEGQSTVSPIPMNTAIGERLACLFVESKEAPETDTMIVVDLDPNRDGDFADAVVQATVPVGRNQVSAHAGHHDAVLLPGGRRIAVTNPGDQSVWILSASDFSVQAKLPLSGTPTRLLAIGG